MVDEEHSEKMEELHIWWFWSWNVRLSLLPGYHFARYVRAL